MIPTLAAMVLAVCTSPGVIDGDTLDMCGTRTRIWGIQAPERSDPEGPAATRALAQLTTGQRVVCYRPPSGQVRDRYNRTVARCEANNQDIAAEMVRGGWAEDWPVFSGGFYARGGAGR